MSETVLTHASPALMFGSGASGEVGYDLLSYDARRDSDVDDLLARALQQQRLLATSPRPVPDEDLATVF